MLLTPSIACPQRQQVRSWAARWGDRGLCIWVWRQQRPSAHGTCGVRGQPLIYTVQMEVMVTVWQLPYHLPHLIITQANRTRRPFIYPACSRRLWHSWSCYWATGNTAGIPNYGPVLYARGLAICQDQHTLIQSCDTKSTQNTSSISVNHCVYVLR